jgi:hypothetical protein
MTAPEKQDYPVKLKGKKFRPKEYVNSAIVGAPSVSDRVPYHVKVALAAKRLEEKRKKFADSGAKETSVVLTAPDGSEHTERLTEVYPV